MPASASGAGRSSTWLAKRDQTGLNTSSRAAAHHPQIVGGLQQHGRGRRQPEFFGEPDEGVLVVDLRQQADAGREQEGGHGPSAPRHGEVEDLLAGGNDEARIFLAQQRFDRVGIGLGRKARRRQAVVARAGLARRGDRARGRVGQDHAASGAVEQARQMQRHRRAGPGDEHGLVSPRHQVSQSLQPVRPLREIPALGNRARGGAPVPCAGPALHGLAGPLQLSFLRNSGRKNRCALFLELLYRASPCRQWLRYQSTKLARPSSIGTFGRKPKSRSSALVSA